MDGTKLKHWRKTRLMTIRQLAKRSGVNHSAISEMERGKRQPRPETMGKLAQALDVGPAMLSQSPWAEAAEHANEVQVTLHMEYPVQGKDIAQVWWLPRNGSFESMQDTLAYALEVAMESMGWRPEEDEDEEKEQRLPS